MWKYGAGAAILKMSEREGEGDTFPIKLFQGL